MSHQQHHSESGRTKSQRHKHDQKQKSYEETTGNPYHLSKGMQTFFAGLVIFMVISVTALFVGGFIRW